MKKKISILISLGILLLSCSDKHKSSFEQTDKSKSVTTSKQQSVSTQISAKPDKKKKNNAKSNSSKMGVPICDKYVNFVCSCHIRYPEDMLLKRACNLGKQSLGDWQKKMKTEEEYKTVVNACTKALLDVQSDPKCKVSIKNTNKDLNHE